MSTPNIAATAVLARYVAASRFESLPAEVVHEAQRALLNWAGCAIGASAHITVENAWNAMRPYAGAAQAALLGRHERTDILNAALVNGVASHVLDFDDTHPDTLVHPSGPAASAALALAELRGATGRELVNAFVAGVEVECRIARAVLPAHYEIGWHITGTAGTFGAAAACARLLGLDGQQTTWALGLAATQAAGLREMFGSMAKSLHPGRAAQNGLAAALLAQSGFTSSATAIEGKRGFAHVLSTTVDIARAVAGLGERYELLANTYKPFACGLVIHPVIDGCVRLRDGAGVRAADVARVDLRVHPLVLELTGKPAPVSGLEGKFSVFHSAAVALLDGAGGEAQYADARVNAADAVALRAKVHAVVDGAMAMDAAHVAVTLANGARHEILIEHCLGSREQPMTDGQLDDKFRAQCEPVLGSARTAAALALLRRIDTLENVRECALACATSSPETGK
jgi:2-methylcitrate dehydratase PrpD